MVGFAPPRLLGSPKQHKPRTTDVRHPRPDKGQFQVGPVRAKQVLQVHLLKSRQILEMSPQ